MILFLTEICEVFIINLKFYQQDQPFHAKVNYMSQRFFFSSFLIGVYLYNGCIICDEPIFREHTSLLIQLYCLFLSTIYILYIISKKAKK